MPRKTPLPPVASFPSKYLGLIQAALRTPLTRTLPHGRAVHYRQRIYTFRRALAAEKHPFAALASTISIRISPSRVDNSADPVTFTIGKAHSDHITDLFEDDITPTDMHNATLATAQAAGFDTSLVVTEEQHTPSLQPEEYEPSYLDTFNNIKEPS